MTIEHGWNLMANCIYTARRGSASCALLAWQNDHVAIARSSIERALYGTCNGRTVRVMMTFDGNNSQQTAMII